WRIGPFSLAVPFTNTGEGKRPYSPVHPRGVFDIAGNLTISWQRRSRLREPGLGNGPLPLGEATEAYEIDILDGSGNAVRTLTSTIPSVEYTALEQGIDGLSQPIACAIYQMSDVRGRGRACRGSFT